MKDKEFKNFEHIIPDNYTINTKGEKISDSNDYYPDVSIKDNEGKNWIILESERKTDRKAFVGSLIKAFFYAYYQNLNLTLIIVMKENGQQTNVEQISNHLKPYFEWLVSLGVKNLKKVLVISDEQYKKSATNKEKILSESFLKRCTILKQRNP
ncbi:MAG: hypothetical protein AB7U85_06625 [Alphaproteobacteria bacterium]